MCIAVFLWRSHPLYPLLLFLNRDEYHNRPTEPLRRWEDGEMVGGRDVVGGGTWLGCTRHGRIAFLTNFREVCSNPNARTRGHLPLRFLQSGKSPTEFAEELEKEFDQYNGFNLVVADVCSQVMVYITNRPPCANSSLVREVSPGIHVLSNANLDSPWPKCLRLKEDFIKLLAGSKGGEFPMKKMTEKVMMNGDKDDEEAKLPGIFQPEIEFNLSSIFIDFQRPNGRYGTRSISALSVKCDGEVCFYEKHLEGDAWKGRTEEFTTQTRNI
ncbi:PREDICTED: transport and Golgi organization protein 2 homolog [Tarenaya hassleriana]|uniref:transport and Golgi organization protein 2 homolog n=1 Tax=Tarenaya hassleriana TaxID=28532 RepID=UPI00053CA1BE|nr:PREDICTED: transport and Golgi organization protein 2 homolog [Tarenaya hassleriana]